MGEILAPSMLHVLYIIACADLAQLHAQNILIVFALKTMPLYTYNRTCIGVHLIVVLYTRPDARLARTRLSPLFQVELLKM